jgi:transposase
MSDEQFVGIDISKTKFDAAIRIGNRFQEAVFDNQLSGFKRCLAWLQKHTQHPWVCLEATGHYSEALADYLHQKNIKVSVVNPMQIKNYAKAILARHKNDTLDARTIALYAQVAPLREFQPRSPLKKQFREWVQLAETLATQRRQLLNQLESIQSAPVRKEYRKLVAAFDKRLAALAEKIKETLSQDEALLHAYDLLIQVKGLGPKSVQTLLAYLPDIRQFAHAKQLAAFAGLSPRQCESGSFKGRTSLSRFGHPRLRNALYMPALVAKRHNPDLQGFVQRLEANGLAPKAIVGALMRKLIHLVYGILSHQQPYNPKRVVAHQRTPR